jgi:dolichyl-phosphate beta-glucosyltransferase
VRAAARDWPSLRLVRSPRHRGKGAAVKRGMLESTGDLVLYMDADHATPILEIESFLPHLGAGGYRAVVGVRTYQHEPSRWRRIIGLGLQVLTHAIVFDAAVVDSQCGFKCFVADVAKDVFGRCRIDGGMFDVEIFTIMQRLGVDVFYQPVHWNNKPDSRIDRMKCYVCDPFDVMAIRLNDLLGRYGAGA